MIEITNLVKKFKNSTPVNGFSATINDGDIVTIIGPSGTGKTTILRCINMLDPPTSGQILIDGEDITSKKCDLKKIRQKVGMVFQSFNLFNHLTVLENVMISLIEIKHLSRQEAYDIAIEQLEKVGLDGRELQYPDQLSGGQKQRVSIARTLAMNPDIILLDEPTSALDPTKVHEIEQQIYRLSKMGKTIIMVTHEMRLAKSISNRIFYVDQGVLYEEGTPEEIFNNPKRERTKAFINGLRVLKYKFNVLEFDWPDYLKRINQFVAGNGISLENSLKMQNLLIKFNSMFIKKNATRHTLMDIIIEYNGNSEEIIIMIYFSSPNESKDILDDLNKAFIPYNISIEEIEDKDYQYKAKCTLKQ